jgi:hypothetical protein
MVSQSVEAVSRQVVSRFGNLRYLQAPRYTARAVQVSATTTSVSKGSFGLSRFQIQAAISSLVGFFSPGISLR